MNLRNQNPYAVYRNRAGLLEVLTEKQAAKRKLTSGLTGPRFATRQKAEKRMTALEA